MKKKLMPATIKILAICFAMISTIANAQEKEFEEYTTDSTERTEEGQNSKKYKGFFVSFGLGTGENLSNDFSGISFGFYGIRKISNVFSYGLDFGYGIRSINFKNTYNTTFIDTFFSPLPDFHNMKAKGFDIGTLALAPYFRINFDPKRNNHQGFYLDFGVNGTYNFFERYNQIFKVGNVSESRIHKGDRFLLPFNYEPFARVGYKKITLMAQVYSGNFFKKSYNFANVNPILISLMFR